MDGQQAEDLLHEVGITVNRNAVPNDPRPPMVTSGLRIGTPALATRGFDEKAFEEVADIIGTALAAGKNADTQALRARVAKWPTSSRCTRASRTGPSSCRLGGTSEGSLPAPAGSAAWGRPRALVGARPAWRFR